MNNYKEYRSEWFRKFWERCKCDEMGLQTKQDVLSQAGPLIGRSRRGLGNHGRSRVNTFKSDTCPWEWVNNNRRWSWDSWAKNGRRWQWFLDFYPWLCSEVKMVTKVDQQMTEDTGKMILPQKALLLKTWVVENKAKERERERGKPGVLCSRLWNLGFGAHRVATVLRKLPQLIPCGEGSSSSTSAA